MYCLLDCFTARFRHTRWNAKIPRCHIRCFTSADSRYQRLKTEKKDRKIAREWERGECVRERKGDSRHSPGSVQVDHKSWTSPKADERRSCFIDPHKKTPVVVRQISTILTLVKGKGDAISNYMYTSHGGALWMKTDLRGIHGSDWFSIPRYKLPLFI